MRVHFLCLKILEHAACKVIAVRATLTVREEGQGRQAKQTHFDFFLRQDGFESGKTVFIREGIIISDVRALRTRGVRSLVVIEDKPIATLLGDAENPAHTQWQTDSSNFKNKYVHGAAYLTFVKEIVYSLVHALRAQEEEEDPNLLLEIFSLPATKEEELSPHPEERKKKKKGEEPDDDPIIIQEPKKKRFRIQKSAGGFTVTRGDAGTQPTTIVSHIANLGTRTCPQERNAFAPKDSAGTRMNMIFIPAPFAPARRRADNFCSSR